MIELKNLGKSKHAVEKEESLATDSHMLSSCMLKCPPEKYTIMYFFDAKGKPIGLTPVEYRQEKLREMGMTSEEYLIRQKWGIKK